MCIRDRLLTYSFAPFYISSVSVSSDPLSFRSAFANCSVILSAVSYTHLDVYKRQPLGIEKIPEA